MKLETIRTNWMVLNSMDIKRIIIFDRIKHSDNIFTYFIAYAVDAISSLCIMMFQMSGFNFDNAGKNMSFMKMVINVDSG